MKCQQNKIQHIKKAEELHPLKMLEGLWQEISINIIGQLPRSNEKKKHNCGHNRPIYKDD